MEEILAGLGKRVFLLHNVHEDAPVLFQVRWAMSYLCGPLTLPQIKSLMAGATVPEAAASVAASAAAAATTERPVLPPEVPQRFLPYSGRPEDGMAYEPRVLGHARVHFVDTRKGLETSETVAFLAGLSDAGVDWYEAEELADFDPDRLEEEPEFEGNFADPQGTVDARALKSWQKDLADTLYRSRRFELWKSSALEALSEPGESERDFRIRLSQAAREAADEEKDKLRETYGKKIERLEEKIRKALQRLEREKEQAKAQKWNTVLNIGTSILGAFTGRKALSRTNLNKARTAARGFGRAVKEGQDVDRVEEDLEILRAEQQELTEEMQAAIDEAADRLSPAGLELETVTLKPRKADIDVRLVVLAWAPVRPGGEAAWR
jgi:hypothetical protein